MTAMIFDAPYRHDPSHPMNPPQFGVRRTIPVDLGLGTIEYLDEALLNRSVAETETDAEIVVAVEYRLRSSGKLVHRSAHVHLKHPTVSGAGSVAAIG